MEKAFNQNEAIDLIKTALQSGSIKLNGAHTTNPAGSGAKDAQYLLSLLTKLQKADGNPAS